MRHEPIRLPMPAALERRLAGSDAGIKKLLEMLAFHQLSDLAELAEFSCPVGCPNGTVSLMTEQFGVAKFDLYDNYFGVERSCHNPADELATAFIECLAAVGEEAKRGHNLHPLAVNLFLRAVQVQAQLILQEAYYVC